MCGISGLVADGLSDQRRREIIDSMSRAMHHRGPDDGGTVHRRNVSLGHRRLSIIDVSRDGLQPMPNEDESLWLVANGEIYNYPDLRAALIRRGHSFRSRTDTETIVHLYEEYGHALSGHLRGMFSFAVLDDRTRTVLIARDRLGIKPLYYFETPSVFVFASEIRALLASGLIPRRLNLAALDQYLAFGYVPPPGTLVEGVKALPAGHQLVRRDGISHLERYWQFPSPEPGAVDPTAVLSELRALLEESVDLHRVSDVPLGAFLSGGIDSTAIVSLMSRIVDRPVKTFSIGFLDGPGRLNELAHARATAQRLGTDHAEIIVSGADVATEMDRVVEAIDQPSFDGLNTYLVSRAARQGGLTVALSGLGGDEIFGGYEIFRLLSARAGWIRAWGGLPAGCKRALARAVPVIARGGYRFEKARRLRDVTSLVDFYAAVRLNLWADERARLYADGVAGRVRESPGYRDPIELLGSLSPPSGGPWQVVSRLELQNYMNWRLLRDTDAMSMIHSLEVRVPFVDHKVVEFVCRLPEGWERRWQFPKRLLTEALRDVIPQDVATRPKQGFQFPIGTWMTTALRPIVEEALAPETVRRRGLFSAEQVSDLLRRFRAGRYPYEVVWQFVILELWMRKVFDA